ncbi:MAG: penicillin-binding transpeptidase domain-containing protein [Actinomycetaceae bacterium]|nr:penicillin-binding protein [Arcanobacterium sp.]MDD7505114.1 penicillin-binding transpeptidase domain-containing protein [Actinomycetaceae bacterium]
MNRPLKKLSIVVILMFVTLMAAVTSVQFFQAPSLNADSRNARTVYREYGIDRGPIIVGNTPVAESTPVDSPYNFQRVYANGPLYAPVTGYFSVVFSSMTGMERAQNAVLGGSDSSLIRQRLEQLVLGRKPQGGGVLLTLDSQLQELAAKGLGDRKGAVVAIEPRTGKILALYSSPSYDPNTLATHSREDANSAWEQINNDERKPLINRAAGGELYPPGSVFKLVTAAAMLENGTSPDDTIEAPTTWTPPGTTVPINNSDGQCGDGSGNVPFRVAFAQSCNTSFAIAGVNLGADALISKAQDFGFGDDLSIPLTVRASRFDEPQDTPALAMDAFGQRDVLASPMAMAMITAAIANNGVLMKPYLVDQVVSANLEELVTTSPEVYSSPLSPENAQALTSMMKDAVASGTGTAAQLGNVDVAGKTGTAEIGGGAEPHAWFVGFDATEEPRVAVAVLVENGGYGGVTAAPIAKSIIEAAVNK